MPVSNNTDEDVMVHGTETEVSSLTRGPDQEPDEPPPPPQPQPRPENLVKRPFYLIAHRANDVSSVARALKGGANAIECDIQYNEYRNVLCVNHDIALFYVRDDLGRYLDGVKKLVNSHPHFSLMIFDCKDTDYPGVARMLLGKIRHHLGETTPLRIILSVSSLSSASFLAEIARDLRSNEAVCIDEENDVRRVANTLVNLGAKRFCYGNGIDTPFIGPSVNPSVTEAVFQKAAGKSFALVYVWTIASRDSMRHYLDLGVDGIIVNDVAALRQVMSERHFSDRVRMATRSDDPFGPSQVPTFLLTVKTGTVTWAGTDANVTFTLRGQRGDLHYKLDAGRNGLLENGKSNGFVMQGKDVGEIRELVVEIDSSGNAPAWFLDRAEVRSSLLARPVSFIFDQWIKPYVRARRSPAVAAFELAIKTGDVSNAGTDAGLTFVLRGVHGELTKAVDTSPVGRFERNNRNTVTLHGMDLGDLRSLAIFNDGSGTYPGWYVESITVKRIAPSPAILHTFRFRRWVEGGASVNLNA